VCWCPATSNDLLHCEHLADRERLHVDRAATPKLICADFSRVRRELPVAGISWYDIDVIEQKEPVVLRLAADSRVDVQTSARFDQLGSDATLLELCGEPVCSSDFSLIG